MINKAVNIHIYSAIFHRVSLTERYTHVEGVFIMYREDVQETHIYELNIVCQANYGTTKPHVNTMKSTCTQQEARQLLKSTFD